MYLLPINGVIGEDFKITDLLMHLNAAKNESIIKLLIGSPGGYTADASKMAEMLSKSGKLVYATNSGDVASAAVELFLTAPRENRTFDPSKGEFLIHMPYLDPKDGGITGTAEEIQVYLDEMKKKDKELIKKYSSNTGTSVNILEGFMKENIPLTPEQIQSLGFATVIQPQVLKAVAYYNKSTDMDTKEVNEKLGVLEGMINKVMNFLKPKALMLKDTAGNELDFGDAIQDETQIVEGVTATVNGQPAEGDYPMANGNVLKFVAGALTEIMPPADETVEALKAENETLKAELEAQKQAVAQKDAEFVAFKGQVDSEMTALRSEYMAFKNQFSKGNPVTTKTPPADPNEPTTRKAFK